MYLHLIKVPFWTLVTLITWIMLAFSPRNGYCFYTDAATNAYDTSVQVIAEPKTDNLNSLENETEMDRTQQHKGRHHKDKASVGYRYDDNDEIMVENSIFKNTNNDYMPKYGDDAGLFQGNDNLVNHGVEGGSASDSQFDTDYVPNYGDDERSLQDDNYSLNSVNHGVDDSSTNSRIDCSSGQLMVEVRACTQGFILQYRIFARVSNDEVTAKLLQDICISYGHALNCLHHAFEACPPRPEHLQFMTRHLPAPDLLRPLCFPPKYPQNGNTRTPAENAELNERDDQAITDGYLVVEEARISESARITLKDDQSKDTYDKNVRNTDHSDYVADKQQSQNITNSNIHIALNHGQSNDSLHTSKHHILTESNDINSYIVKHLLRDDYENNHDHQSSPLDPPKNSIQSNKNTQQQQQIAHIQYNPKEGNNDYPHKKSPITKDNSHSSSARGRELLSGNELSAVSHSLRDTNCDSDPVCKSGMSNASSKHGSLDSRLNVILVLSILLLLHR